jgi:hypothetical protein
MMKQGWFLRNFAMPSRIIRPASAIFSFLLLALFLVNLPTNVRAQTTEVASVSGSVSDASGAVIAGATVIMVETDKHLTHTVMSDSGGRYNFPNLPIGPYSMEVKMSGFKDFVESGIVLVVNNNIELNVTLEVGAATQRVEVKASATMVETKETSVSSMIDEQRIAELPLDNRQATQLIITLGAAVYADSGDLGSKSFWSATRISVGGGQGNGTAYLMDGGDYTAPMSNVNMPFPFPDALQEFSIETSAVSSRFGTHPGATVNAVTKSGSNQFHGDLFEYLRNGDLDARNFFAAKHDTLKRNQFGGTAGGKIITDKLFYFGGFQGTRNRLVSPSNSTHIPTAAMVNGDFTTIASASCGKAVTLKAPFGTGGYGTNMINPTLFDPVAMAFIKQYIVPLQSQASSCGTIFYSVPVTGDSNEYIARTDYAQSSKNNIYARYYGQAYTNPPVFTNILTTTSPGNLEFAQSATIGDTYTINSTTLNSFHISWNRVRDDRGPTSTPANWTLLGQAAGIPASQLMYSAIPNFLLISSMTGGFASFCGTCAPGWFNVNDEQIADDVDLIRGRHEISLGFNIIRVQNDTNSGFDENGAPTWNGSFTGLGMGDFMVGEMSDFQQTNHTPDDLRQWVMSFYAQDSFKFSKHLTFNIGLRWEPTFADPDKYGRGDSFSPTGFLAGTISTVHPTAPPGLFFPGDPGIPPANWNGHIPNFGPRVGLVWNPSGTGRDTLRIGAGLLYDSAETWFNERETTNPPFGNDIDVGSTGLLSNPWKGYTSPSGTVGVDPFPQAPGGALFFPSFGTYISFPVNPPPTSMLQWNATYQRQFAGNWVASISYLGNETSHLWIGHESDPALFLGTGACTFPGPTGPLSYTTCSTTSNTNQRRVYFQDNPVTGQDYASVSIMDPGAVARYEGVLVSVTHRLSNNFTALANFTDSECWSDYDFGAAYAGASNSQRFNRQADWGRCISDTRSNFNFSMVAHSPWKLNGVAGRFANNWELAPLIRGAGGQPLTITTGTDNSLSGLGNDRPNYTGQPLRSSAPNSCPTAPCYQFLNPAAFTPNLPLGSYGSVERNGVRGPNYFGFDLALARAMKLNERFNLQIRAEAFNILNHVNFFGQTVPSGLPVSAFNAGTVSSALNASTFGQATGAYDPRILQFSMKVVF